MVSPALALSMAAPALMAQAADRGALVRLEIEEMLNQLPERYSRELCQQKCEVVYQHVYDAYADAGRSVYAPVV